VLQLDWDYLPYAFPIAVNALLMAGLAMYIWTRRYRANGLTAFVWFLLSVVWWSLAYTLEILSSGQAAKIAWVRLEYAGIVAVTPLWLQFAVRYEGRATLSTPRRAALLFVIPLATFIMVLTSARHSLFWSAVSLETIGAVPTLGMDYGPWFWVHAVYTYALALAAVFVLVRMAVQRAGLYRLQALLLVVATLIPWLANILYLTGANPFLGLDLTPIGFAIAGVVVIAGAMSLRLLDIVPAGRDAVLESLPDPVFVLDDANRLVDANPAGVHILGRAPGDLIGRPVHEVLPKEIAGGAGAEEGSAERLTEIALEVGGQVRHYAMRSAVLRGAQGYAMGRVIVLQDVTLRQGLETAERDQRVLAEVLADTAEALNSTLNLDEVLDRILDNIGRVVPHEAANIMLIEDGLARVVRARGYERWVVPEEVKGLRLRVIDVPNFQRMAETGQAVIFSTTSAEAEWVDLASMAWVRSYAGMPIRSAGEVVGFLNLDSASPGFFRPEHAARLSAFADQVAVAIRNARLYGESEARNRQLALLNEITRVGAGTLEAAELIQSIAHSVAGLIGGDACYITFWDEDAQRVRPAAASGLTGQAYHSTVPEAGETALTAAVLSLGQPLPIEDVQDTPHLSRHIADQFSARSMLALPLIADHRKLGAILLAFNAPHRFTGEEIAWAQQAAELTALALAKAHAYATLEERNRELDTYSHTVAHDLKAPTALVVGYNDLLRDLYASRLPAEALELLDQADFAARRVIQIVDSLLLLAEVRGSEVPRQPVDMAPVVDAAVKRLSAKIQERGIDVHIGPDLPPVVGYAPWLEEVIANLVSNAVKYIGDNNPAPRVTVCGTRQGEVARYEVIDNGLGIAPEDQHRLFQMFTRLHPRAAEGLGLGLSIVQRIITRLRGEVGVQSEPGVETIFWFTLPAAGPEDRRQHAE
jgi:PAS domain S-box-containing protein